MLRFLPRDSERSGVLAHATRKPADSTVFVVFVAIVTLVIEQESKAYTNPFLSAFCAVCCWQILLFVLFLLLLDAAFTSGRQAANRMPKNTT